MSKLNKIQGAVIGGAIGDAVGFLVEKSPIEQCLKFVAAFEQENFLIKNRTYPKTYEFGQYSDDTQFSKLLMESYVDNTSFLNALVEGYKNNSLVGLGKNTKTLLSLHSKGLEIPLEKVENISNGSVMRSWPVGLLFSCPLSIETETKKHAQITHNTQWAIDSSVFVAKVISMVLNQKEVAQEDLMALAPLSLKELLEKALSTDNAEELRVLLLSDKLPDWEGVPPFARETAVAAVVSFIKNKSKDFKTTLAYGLSLGGDTDSVCSVLGALKGCSGGLNSINPFLRDMVHDEGKFSEEYLLNLADKVFKYSK